MTNLKKTIKCTYLKNTYYIYYIILYNIDISDITLIFFNQNNLVRKKREAHFRQNQNIPRTMNLTRLFFPDSLLLLNFLQAYIKKEIKIDLLHMSCH